MRREATQRGASSFLLILFSLLFSAVDYGVVTLPVPGDLNGEKLDPGG